MTVQLMANFKGFSSQITSKCVSISHIITNLTTILAHFLGPALLWSGYNLALTR